MRTNFKELIFSRAAYLTFMVCIIVALLPAHLPVPIFLGFLAAIALIGLTADAICQFALRTLAQPSQLAAGLAAERFRQEFDPASIASANGLLAVVAMPDDDQEEPEFSQTRIWFSQTTVGSFA